MTGEFRSKQEAEQAFSKLREEFENLFRLCELQAAEIELLRKQKFGPKGEHLTAEQRGQLHLFEPQSTEFSDNENELPNTTNADGAASAAFRIPEPQSKPGRRKLPLDLPRVSVTSGTLVLCYFAIKDILRGVLNGFISGIGALFSAFTNPSLEAKVRLEAETPETARKILLDDALFETVATKCGANTFEEKNDLRKILTTVGKEPERDNDSP